MKTAAWILALAMVCSLAACGPRKKATAPLTIGFCMDTLVLERWQKDRDIFTEEAGRLGAQVVVHNANGDIGLQKRQVKELIEQNVSAIVIIAIDSDAFVELVDLARKRSIPVIAYDRLIANAGITCLVDFDTENIGKYMVHTVAERAGTGNYVILGGSLLDNNMRIIADGIKEELAARQDIVLSGEAYCENWSSSSAFEKLSAILAENRQVDAVLCGNDALAVGAIRALSEYQLAGKVAVSGQDADLESCQRIVEGTQTMTVYKPIGDLARTAAGVVVSLAKGETPTGGEEFSDGSYNIRRYAVPTQIVTADNMLETIVASGFHKLEDVYRNVPQEQWPETAIQK